MVEYAEMKEISNIPKHVAIIPDGNRRWAKREGLPTLEGHRRGLHIARELVKTGWSLGIQIMTVWGFSTENWSREKTEIDYLMNLFVHFAVEGLDDAKNNGARFIHIGRKDRLPKGVLDKLTQAEIETKHFSERFMVLALDYGGQDELCRAVQALLLNNPTPEITPHAIASYLDTRLLPQQSPDLIIRTGGEQRTSGFMNWQNSYSELMFVEKYLPEFLPVDFVRCIENYQLRHRRFGK